MKWLVGFFGKASVVVSSLKIYALVFAVGVSIGTGGTWYVMHKFAQAEQVAHLNAVRDEMNEEAGARRVTGEALAMQLLALQSGRVENAREILSYVSSDSNSGCVLDVGGVRGLNNSRADPLRSTERVFGRRPLARPVGRTANGFAGGGS